MHASRRVVPWLYQRRALSRSLSKQVNDNSSKRSSKKASDTRRRQPPPRPILKDDGIRKEQTKRVGSITPQDGKSQANIRSGNVPPPPTTTMMIPPDHQSLFDVFQVPEAPAPPTEEDETFVDQTAWNSYQEIMDIIIRTQPNNKFLRQHTAKPIPNHVAEPVIQWLYKEETVVPYDLSVLEEAIQMTHTVLDHHGGDFKRDDGFSRQVALQRERFARHLKFDKKQMKMIQGALVQASNLCAKLAKAKAVPVIWNKVKEAGIAQQGLLHSLLHVSCTFSTTTTSRRLKRAKYGHLVGVSVLDIFHDHDLDEESTAENVVDETDQIAIYHNLLYEPTEQSVNVRIRLLVAQGMAKEAELLLDKYAVKAELRLRVYTPILRLYLELNDVSSALRLYSRMRNMPLVHIEAETYIDVIAGLAERGCFAPSAAEIRDAKALGYTYGSGPGLFNEIVEQMAQEIIEIPLALAKRIFNALAQGFPDSGLVKTSSLAPLKLAESLAKNDELIISRVRIDSSTGQCPRSGVTLRLITPEEEEREKLICSILSLAGNVWNEFTKKRGSQKASSHAQLDAGQNLEQFLQMLNERDGEPITALVDGPNVGYYMQNFENGRFSFHQIKLVVDSLKNMGERPLVILPLKYTRKDNFTVTIGSATRKQILTTSEAKIQEELIQSGIVYAVPYSFLDDFYWILASIADQTKSRKGRNLYVAPDDPEGRWPGARPMLVSNDQMRDHRISLMEPKLFRRWYSNHIVNYNFAAFIDGVCPNPEIAFSAADVFSREIQSNVSQDNSVAWHFPLSETEDEWFCVRIPAIEKKAS